MFCLLFYQKNIQRNLRAAFIYSIHRLEKIKTLYWSNQYKFTCFVLKNNLTCNELNFLQNYDELIYCYSNQINIDINKNLINYSSRFIINLDLKRNLLFIINSNNFKVLKKKVKYFLPIFGVERLIELGLVTYTN
nr:hypothetical protein CcurKRNrm2_p099 [Cryptomonas curvata]